MSETKYILEYTYVEDNEWRFEDEFSSGNDAHHAMLEHIKSFNHIKMRVRKLKYVAEESVVGEYTPIASGDYES